MWGVRLKTTERIKLPQRQIGAVWSITSRGYLMQTTTHLVYTKSETTRRRKLKGSRSVHLQMSRFANNGGAPRRGDVAIKVESHELRKGQKRANEPCHAGFREGGRVTEKLFPNNNEWHASN